MMCNKMIAVVFCITPLLSFEENRSAYDKYWDHGDSLCKYNSVYAKGDISEIEKMHEKDNVGYNSKILTRNQYEAKFRPLEYALICGHTDLALFLLKEKTVKAAGSVPIFLFVQGIQLREIDEISVIDTKKYSEILKEMVGRSGLINGILRKKTPLAAYIAPKIFDSYLNPT